jgi:GNAT superfamily N-acetyltransferase
MITIKEARSKSEMKDFVMFPFQLYKDNPNWIPPIISDEIDSFNPRINPAFEHAEAYFYLAYRDGKIVGRTAAIINWSEVNDQGKKKVRFGWFDVIDDIEVTKALLEKVYELGRRHGLENVEGPMGFSNLDKVGVLTEGFDQIGTMITWYNNAYYKDHFEQLGFVKEKQFLESLFSFADVSDKDAFFRAAEMMLKRYGLTLLEFTSTRQIMPYVDEMFDIFNAAYAKLSSFVAVSEIQKEYFKKKYINLINPEYIKFVMDKDGRLVAFSIVMPDFSEALKKARGRLFPFGFWHLIQARKHSKAVLFYLIGILPEYQNKGVTAIIMKSYYDTFTAKGITQCIRTPELDENHAIHNLWKNFNPVIHKRRCTYIKLIDN